MSYAMQESLGETASWWQFYTKPEDVYLWRARLVGAALSEPSDAQAVLRAVARAVSKEMDLDVRGIVADPDSAGTSVDVVLTSDITRPYGYFPVTADVVARRVAEDPDLRTLYPGLTINGYSFLELKGPPASKDFWASHAVVWDDVAGPMDAFAKLQGIYRGGQADDGPGLVAWTTSVKPPPGQQEPPPQAPMSGPSPIVTALFAVAAAGAVFWLAGRIEETTDKRGRRA